MGRARLTARYAALLLAGLPLLPGDCGAAEQRISAHVEGGMGFGYEATASSHVGIGLADLRVSGEESGEASGLPATRRPSRG
jgi:hypothetical protein